MIMDWNIQPDKMREYHDRRAMDVREGVLAVSTCFNVDESQIGRMLGTLSEAGPAGISKGALRVSTYQDERQRGLASVYDDALAALNENNAAVLLVGSRVILEQGGYHYVDKHVQRVNFNEGPCPNRVCGTYSND